MPLNEPLFPKHTPRSAVTGQGSGCDHHYPTTASLTQRSQESFCRCTKQSQQHENHCLALLCARVILSVSDKLSVVPACLSRFQIHSALRQRRIQQMMDQYSNNQLLGEDVYRQNRDTASTGLSPNAAFMSPWKSERKQAVVVLRARRWQVYRLSSCARRLA